MIAMALACRPRLLLADEPTTALDVTVRQQIVDLLIELQEQEAAARGMAVLLITHDLNLVRRFAQRVAVMEQGVLVETNTTAALFAAPQRIHAPAARQRAATRHRAGGGRRADDPRRAAARRRLPHRDEGLARGIRQDGVSGRTRREAEPETRRDARHRRRIGVGKSTLAAAVLGLQRPASGGIEIDGMPLASLRTTRGRRTLYGRMQVVFQDPFGSLSPRMTVEQIVGEGSPCTNRRWPAPRGARGSPRCCGGRPAGRSDAALSARIFRRPAPAHRDRARWRWSPSSWCWTSRRARSTCRSRSRC
jgi:microcin C transport system ATP-binding protein